MDSDYNWNDHSRRIVIESREALERTSASLARSNQIAIETEQIGTEVLSDLSEQREALLRTQRRLDNANEDLSKSGAAIRAIRRNVLYNKIILVGIIILEVFILGALLFLKLRK
ncbi:unnamed protein product [Hermetia illucens]|uniref:Uncharacterized protein n=1 Tax=Hermetia illucens TaxID=343691 RepID=A0A7R8UMZ7_HERIL|nr:vesicle transport through interaction with t-SNAREs homolog 1B [Hermetia illucens]CAD7083825.1 unnamed protein product [Hermetia illucens]